jgi:serine/threonine protein kinase
MTTRDPRLRDLVFPEHQGNGRDPTQSLALDGDDDYAVSHPSLALGTHEASREERTKIESPGARSKTPAPPKALTRPPPVPTRDDPDDRIGRTLGSYKVLELLGKGGMGFVYRAEHVKLGREVALKLLRSDYARRKDAVARFIQEARTVNRIRHRNIVDVPDIIELDDGTTCIVMEFLRGQSLGKWARSGVDLPRALAVLVQICDGLAAAHAVDIVHRDLKPDNVFIVPTADGAELVKLLDFGVAKLLHREDEDIGFQTAAGSVIGTPAYMSPEQAGGMPIDARSDIYSLGAIMYELFCGQPMFRGRSFGEFVRKHLTEMPVPPRQTAGGAHMDERLEAVIMKALEKDPNRRFGHILELRDALLHLLGGMETYLPGYAAMQSGLRPAPPAPMMATLPPMPIPGMPTPGAGHVSMSSSIASMPSIPSLASVPSMQEVPVLPSGPYAYGPYGQSQHHSQIMAMPTPPPPAPTPWWVWVVGGAVAIAVGVGAAIWYAGREQATKYTSRPAPSTTAEILAPSPDPAPAAGETPAPATATPKFVTVRVESTPSGGVYESGSPAELCRTPCEFNVDLGDGGSTTQRTYLVKADGHRDGSLVVDLTAERPQGQVTLAPLSPEPSVRDQVPTGLERTDKRPSRTGRTGRAPTDKVADKAVDKSVDKSSDRSSAGAVDKSVDKPTDKSTTSTSSSSSRTTDRTTEKKPTERSGAKIDRSDTLDPFRTRP